jgi:multiple sugar transport system permease protein
VKINRKITPWILVGPSLVVIGVLLLYPLVFAFVISFFRWHLSYAQHSFIGFANYIWMWQDSRFLNDFQFNVIFMLICLGTELLLGLTLALLLNLNLPQRNVFRTLFLLPFLISPILAGYNWKWMLNQSYGAINLFISLFGGKPVPWLSKPLHAKISVMIVDIWQFTPLVMLFLLAGLQSLPNEVYEAATVDGASALQKFRSVTLPLIKPVLGVVSIIRIVDLWRVFDTVFIMTEGGPGFATELLPVYVYRTAFNQLNFGYAAALSYLGFFTTLVFLIPFIKLAWSK